MIIPENQVQSPIIIISCLIEITKINICNTTVIALYADAACCMMLESNSNQRFFTGPSTQFFINLSFQKLSFGFCFPASCFFIITSFQFTSSFCVKSLYTCNVSGGCNARTVSFCPAGHHCSSLSKCKSLASVTGKLLKRLKEEIGLNKTFFKDLIKCSSIFGENGICCPAVTSSSTFRLLREGSNTLFDMHMEFWKVKVKPFQTDLGLRRELFTKIQTARHPLCVVRMTSIGAWMGAVTTSSTRPGGAACEAWADWWPQSTLTLTSG